MHFLKTEILQNIFPFLKNLLIEIGFFFLHDFLSCNIYIWVNIFIWVLGMTDMKIPKIYLNTDSLLV